MLRRLLLFAALLMLAPVSARAQAGGDQVVLRPGDLLRVTIWREPDLTGDFQVSENGTVTFPMLGVRPVAGIPLVQLRESLMREYLQQLRNPSITITPLRRVNILGEVRTPGLYSVDPTVSLLGALALAGGTTPEGDLQRVSLTRAGARMAERLTATETLDRLDVRSGDQIVVQRRTWMSRNSATVVASLISLFTAVTTTLIVIATRDNGGGSSN
ncbi:MAG TPA: polysaccharide biosynthesis/export family protein [Longimicrobiaceae bacterium]|nr:polysaccharide biosynthesis/export family protein [Longimicrobiaceae bacterium]